METIFFKVVYLYFHGCECFSDTNTVSCCRKSQYFSFYRKNLLPTIQTEREIKKDICTTAIKKKKIITKIKFLEYSIRQPASTSPTSSFLQSLISRIFFCEIYEAQTDVALLNMCCTDLLVE